MKLVEIGGSFRIPEVMESAGAKLKEVGTMMNPPQRLRITQSMRMPDPVETSLNFEIVGPKEGTLEELVDLGKKPGSPQ